ncbi:unnamed protein product [Protopolystoma xenopodis]|uniref:Uncharacterized protein n=1 Tax=Protopolystoma xenopodis TaxID=117903 RepID=A0A3S5A2G7_9PLAT|nr:unnamed protein product [Protopolystoma xenopodis]
MHYSVQTLIEFFEPLDYEPCGDATDDLLSLDYMNRNLLSGSQEPSLAGTLADPIPSTPTMEPCPSLPLSLTPPPPPRLLPSSRAPEVAGLRFSAPASPTAQSLALIEAVRNFSQPVQSPLSGSVTPTPKLASSRSSKIDENPVQEPIFA